MLCIRLIDLPPGIPRLREILMTATVNIKTPIMTVPLCGSVAAAERLAAKLRRVTLADLLQSVSVTQSLAKALHDVRDQVYVTPIPSTCVCDTISTYITIDGYGAVRQVSL